MDHLLEFEADDMILQVREAPVVRKMVDIESLIKPKECYHISLSTRDWMRNALQSMAVAMFNDDNTEQFLKYWKEPIKRSDQLKVKVENAKKNAVDCMNNLDSMISISLPARAAKLQQAKSEVVAHVQQYKTTTMQNLELWINLLDEYQVAVQNLVKDWYISDRVSEKVRRELHDVVDLHVTNSEVQSDWIPVVHSMIDEEILHCVEKSKQQIQSRIKQLHDTIFSDNAHYFDDKSVIDLVKWNSPQIDCVLKASVAFIDANLVNIMMQLLVKYEKFIGNTTFYEVA